MNFSCAPGGPSAKGPVSSKDKALPRSKDPENYALPTVESGEASQRETAGLPGRASMKGFAGQQAGSIQLLKW